jgi:hypothetical protein
LNAGNKYLRWKNKKKHFILFVVCFLKMTKTTNDDDSHEKSHKLSKTFFLVFLHSYFTRWTHPARRVGPFYNKITLLHHIYIVHIIHREKLGITVYNLRELGAAAALTVPTRCGK